MTGNCAHCGQPLKSGQSFCSACGAPVDAAEPSRPVAEGGRHRADTVRGGIPWWLVVVAAVLVIGGAGVAGSVFGQGDSSSSSESLNTDITGPEPAASDFPTTSVFQTEPPGASDTTSRVAPATTTTTMPAPLPTVTPPTSTTVPGDLEVLVVMQRPECDVGLYVVFIGASVNPGRYPEEITRILEANPTSHYLRTDVTCSSLRYASDDGHPIYAVFLGPYETFEQACDARVLGPSGSYVKPLDNTTDPTAIQSCP